MTDIDDILTEYDLPELPEPAEFNGDDDDSEDTVELVLARFQQGSVSLGDGFTEADAQAYCQRDDTRDPAGDWFVFYRR